MQARERKEKEAKSTFALLWTKRVVYWMDKDFYVNLTKNYEILYLDMFFCSYLIDIHSLSTKQKTILIFIKVDK